MKCVLLVVAVLMCSSLSTTRFLVRKGFGTFSNRQTYIIDPKGNLRWVFTDVESRIARHSQEVLDKLTELTA